MVFSYKPLCDEGRQRVAKTFLKIGCCLMNNSYVCGHTGVAVEICFLPEQVSWWQSTYSFDRLEEFNLRMGDAPQL